MSETGAATEASNVGCVVVVFGRLPAEGRVKTRLAAGVGDAAAASFYAACLAHTLGEAAACVAAPGAATGCCALHYADASDAAALEEWVTVRVPRAALQLVAQEQSTQDLGERLHAAFAHSFAAPGAARVVVCGSDVPALSADVIRRALDALKLHECVLGPAADGGYYLVGLTAPRACLFSGVPWSTAGVLDATLHKAREAGLCVAPLSTLPTLADVDTRADLEAWLRSRTALPPDDALVTSALAGLRPPA